MTLVVLNWLFDYIIEIITRKSVPRSMLC